VLAFLADTNRVRHPTEQTKITYRDTENHAELGLNVMVGGLGWWLAEVGQAITPMNAAPNLAQPERYIDPESERSL